MQLTDAVAEQLHSKVLNFGPCQGIITETEAYLGRVDDSACHASRGKTKRTAIMFAEEGHSYVYLRHALLP